MVRTQRTIVSDWRVARTTCAWKLAASCHLANRILTWLLLLVPNHTTVERRSTSIERNEIARVMMRFPVCLTPSIGRRTQLPTDQNRVTMTCTGGRLAAFAEMDDQRSVPRDVCRYVDEGARYRHLTCAQWTCWTAKFPAWIHLFNSGCHSHKLARSRSFS